MTPFLNYVTDSDFVQLAFIAGIFAWGMAAMLLRAERKKREQEYRIEVSKKRFERELVAIPNEPPRRGLNQGDGYE